MSDVGPASTAELERVQARVLVVLGGGPVTRKEPLRGGFDDRPLVVLAREAADRIERFEACQGDESDFVAVWAPQHVGAVKAADRAHRWKQLVEQKALVRIGICWLGPPAPQAGDHASGAVGSASTGAVSDAAAAGFSGGSAFIEDAGSVIVKRAPP